MTTHRVASIDWGLYHQNGVDGDRSVEGDYRMRE